MKCHRPEIFGLSIEANTDETGDIPGEFEIEIEIHVCEWSSFRIHDACVEEKMKLIFGHQMNRSGTK